MHLAPQEIRTYFVTAVTAQRRRLLQISANAELLQRTMIDYRDQGRFLLHAFVIMPDHFHAIFTPAPDVSLERAMQYIKGGFSFRLKSKLDVWMRSFNQTQILSEEKFTATVGYMSRTRFAAAWLHRRSNTSTVLRTGKHRIPCLRTCGRPSGPKGPQESASHSGA
jgi:putative transposase